MSMLTRMLASVHTTYIVRSYFICHKFEQKIWMSVSWRSDSLCMTLLEVTKGQEPRDYRLTIRIPTSLHQAIKRTAVEDKRSVSDWIVVTLQAVIAEREERACVTESAPASDAKASPETLHRAMRSLSKSF